MRSLHRDLGYFVLGITIIYAMSGIILIYRDTNFLKSEKTIEKQLAPNLQASELGKAMQKRGFEVLKSEGYLIYFQNGTYNKTTGVAKYADKTLPPFIEKINNLHKASSKDLSHLLSTIFGFILLFLAVSSFWMFKPKSKQFRRGILFAGAGLVFTLILILL